MTLQMNTGAVRRFAKAMKFGAWLQSIPNKVTPVAFRLVQIGSAYWQSRALFVAVRLDVATVLGVGNLSTVELAGRVGANGDALGRLMRLLAAMGIFEETAPMVFSNNKLSRCLCSDDRRSVRAMILMHNSEAMSRPWCEQLEAGIRSGSPPFQLSHGEDLFDYLDHHVDFDQLFSEAMDSVEALAGDGFATDLDWGRFDRIIDVGGSRGTKALTILKRHPKLSALIVDRPQVVDEATRYWQITTQRASNAFTFRPETCSKRFLQRRARKTSICSRRCCTALTTIPAYEQYRSSAKPSATAAPAQQYWRWSCRKQAPTSPALPLTRRCSSAVEGESAL